MTGLVAIAVGAVVVVAGALWFFVRRDGKADPTDLGTISSSWIAERRTYERDGNDR